MFKQLSALRDALLHKDVHPLTDQRELRRVLDALPADHPYKALDEIVGWLESMQGEVDMQGEALFEAIRLLDEAAQTPLRRLARDYLTSARQSRADEKRLWMISHGFHHLLSNLYERCLVIALQKTKSGEFLKPFLPLIAARLIAALGGVLKWQQFHYGEAPGQIWQRLGRVMTVVENNGIADKPFMLYPGLPAMTTPVQEFVRVVAFQAASMDSLLPLEIEVAERLIAHFLSGFVFTARVEEDSVYWLDLDLPQAPQRMARMPKAATPTLRFFKPGGGHANILALLHLLEQGGDVPANINLGAQYPVRLLIPVLRHLAAYLAPIPPQRSHDRHLVKNRMSVLNGLVNAFVVFSGDFGGRPAGLQMESWVVENVSRGGFGALLNSLPGEWLKVGALITMQPEGGDNWLLGIVRRYNRESENEARVGIQTLAQEVVSVELKPRRSSSYAAAAGIPGLLIRGAGDEVQMVLPPASFDLRENLECILAGRSQLLTPVAMREQTADYEVARYRLSPA